MKLSHTCNSKYDIEIDSNVIPLTLEYNKELISTFPTETYQDFEPDAELTLEKAMIRYNDNDINDADGKELSRSLFKHPCNFMLIQGTCICLTTVARKTSVWLT